MRWWKRILFSFLALLLGLGLLVGGAFALVWLRPDLVLNEKRARQALRWAPPELQIKWQKLNFEFEPLRGWGKRIKISAAGLCAVYEKNFDTCLERAEIEVSVRFRSWRPKITELGLVELVLSHFTLFASTEPEEVNVGPLPDLRPPKFADYFPEESNLALLRAFELRAEKVTLESQDGAHLTGRAEIKLNSASAENATFRVSADVAQAPGLKISLAAQAFLKPNGPSLQLQGELKGSAAGWRGRIPLKGFWSDSIRLQANPILQKKTHALDTDLSLIWKKEELQLELGSLASNSLWKQGRIESERCQIRGDLNAEGLPREAELKCGIRVRPRNRLIPSLNAALGARAKFQPLRGDKFRLEFNVSGDSADSFLESRLRADGNVVLGGAEPENPTLNLSLHARVPEFTAWKEAWEGTAFAIPAPIHTMKGAIDLNVTSQFSDPNLLVADITFQSNLRDTAKQSFLLASSAKVRVRDPLKKGRAVNVEAEARLADISLEAPPLRLEEPPRPLPDKRFVTNEQYKAQQEKIAAAVSQRKNSPSIGPPFEWQLKLKTESPVKIHTNLLPNPLPIAVDLQLSSKASLAGYFEVLPMPIEIFRKKAELQKFRVSYPAGSKVGQLDGRIDHRTPELLTKILVLGSTEAPRVDFESEPPLSRQQIVSALLFNKSLAELSEEEASSTQNMSQALSDGALGLFSLFFLSSTPIQSVGYDPVTQSYSARVGLGSKTTFSVGSDFVESREFGLRRRLGGPWAIRTELKQEQDRPDVVLTLLEWFKRF